MLRSSLIVAATMLAANVVCAEGVAPAGQANAAASLSESPSQQFARDRLQAMAGTLGAAERFSVSMNVAFDVVQDNGQKIEFGEVREIAVQRPDRLRVLEAAADGSEDLLLFDGATITVQSGAANVYAQAPQPGGIDDAVKYFVRDLGMRLPLAPMLLKDFAGELQRRVVSVDYVGFTEMQGERVHHVAARTTQADIQVWMRADEAPVPLRVVMSYPDAEGHPQFRADFSRWSLAPTFAPDHFAFKPTSDALQIPFAVQFAPQEGSEAADGAVTEGVKP